MTPHKQGKKPGNKKSSSDQKNSREPATFYDKISLLLGALALLVSIISPVATFLWFGETREALRYAGRLTATATKTSTLVDGTIVDATVALHIENVGHQPVGNIRVSLTPVEQVDVVKVSPYVPVELMKMEGGVLLSTGAVLGRGEEMDMEISIPVQQMPPDMLTELEMWIVSEVGTEEIGTGEEVVTLNTRVIFLPRAIKLPGTP